MPLRITPSARFFPRRRMPHFALSCDEPKDTLPRRKIEDGCWGWGRRTDGAIAIMTGQHIFRSFTQPKPSGLSTSGFNSAAPVRRLSSSTNTIRRSPRGRRRSRGSDRRHEPYEWVRPGLRRNSTWLWPDCTVHSPPLTIATRVGCVSRSRRPTIVRLGATPCLRNSFRRPTLTVRR